MNCDAARVALSARADNEPYDAAADEHVAGCAPCRAFDADIAAVRQLLRYEPVDRVPDVAPAVRAAVARPHRRRPTVPTVAAALAVGVVAGTLFVGLERDPATVAAADLPTLVLDAQHAIDSLTATIEIDGAVGTLAYRAPEQLAIVTDRLTTVVDDDRWWATADGETARVVEHREPFAATDPVPLDLIAPVDALGGAAPPAALGTKEVDGRAAVGIRVTAGQVAALLDGLDPLHSLHPVHPTDPADLWLDEDSLVPLELTVRAAPTAERNRWAAGLGLDDGPGAVVRRVRLTDVRLNSSSTNRTPDPPDEARFTDDGFIDGPAPDVPAPAALPEGMRPHRRGAVTGGGTPVEVATWSDGRAWLSVRATTAWAGDRLFGGLGPIVSPVDLGAAGVAYRDEDGTHVAVHADELDLVVTGSLPPEQLVAIAGSLGVAGRPVPADWAEAMTAELDDVHGVLVPDGLQGFGTPAVRIDGEFVTLVYGGAGDRSFRLVRSDLTRLPPPLDPDVIAVRVRGTDGRYDPGDGTLEWVDGGAVYSLRSATLSEAELLGIAETLRVRP